MNLTLSTLLPPNPNLLSYPNPTRKLKPINPISSSKPEPIELRVCVNRSCSRQGSRSILDLLSSLAPQSVSVSSCGCLGRCGAGPNIAVAPRGEIFGHCGTPARAARVLEEVCGRGFDAGRSLEAVTLRRKAEEEVELGNFDEAEALLSKAYICQGDAFMVMEEWAAAEKAYSNALLIDPSIRRSRSFKAKVAKLQEKLILSDASS